MTYAIRFTPRAARDLTRLPEKIAAAVIEFCHAGLAENPQRVGGELNPPFAPARSARRGDYRVIYRINESEQVVEVLAVRRRAEVYRT